MKKEKGMVTYTEDEYKTTSHLGFVIIVLIALIMLIIGFISGALIY
jgi:hypothetical protein